MRAKVLELGKKLFDGDVTKVIVPAADGEMCLLPNHISIMASMRNGNLKIFRAESDRPISISVNGGMCSFSDNNAIFILY